MVAFALEIVSDVPVTLRVSPAAQLGPAVIAASTGMFASSTTTTLEAESSVTLAVNVSEPVPDRALESISTVRVSAQLDVRR